ncbi:MAG: hypothetical protein LUD76_07020 [Alistipes sp.]|nr:hypothetical protein [Alistipes sp.]
MSTPDTPNYFSLQESVKTHFKEYVDTHSFEECACHHNEIETYSETDAMLFAICMLTAFDSSVWNRERSFTDHLGCVAYHAGSPSMLIDLLGAGASAKDGELAALINELVSHCVQGLSKTARKEHSYGDDTLEKLRKYAAGRNARD